MILEIPHFDPDLHLGVSRLDPVPPEPSIDLDLLAVCEPVELFSGQRSLSGPDAYERLAAQSDMRLVGPATLAALCAQPGQVYLNQFRTLHEASWIEAWGHLLVGDLYGSGDQQYALVAAYRPSTGRWHLWFRMHDDRRVRTDYVLAERRLT